MKTYAEFLAENGATSEDIKLLDTPAARRGYEAMQTQLATATAAREKAEADAKAVNDWYKDQATPYIADMKSKLTIAEANVARAAEVFRQSQDDGLVEIAKKLGYLDADGNPVSGAPRPAASAAASVAAPDLSKYITVDKLSEMSNSVGEGLAALQDLVMEHQQLFPGQRLNVRALRSEASAAHKPVYQYWEEKFGVPAARAAAEKAASDAHDKKLREEGAAQARQEFADRYGNPDTRPLTTSHSPFAPRPDTGRDKQPWDRQNDASSDRVSRATQHVVKELTAPRGVN